MRTLCSRRYACTRVGLFGVCVRASREVGGGAVAHACVCLLHMAVQMRAYEKLSPIRPKVTLRPVDTVKLEDVEDVFEYRYISGLLLPYVDGLSLVWGDKWPELLPHSSRAQVYERMATVRDDAWWDSYNAVYC